MLKGDNVRKGGIWMEGWVEEVRQLADQYSDPQSASREQAFLK